MAFNTPFKMWKRYEFNGGTRGIGFAVIAPDIDESVRDGEHPVSYVRRLSEEKARAGGGSRSERSRSSRHRRRHDG